MKFLITQKPIDAPPAPEMAKALAQAFEASIQRFKDLKQANKLESVYAFPEGGGLAVVNVESAEELNEILLSIPITAFGAIECRVLSDIEATAQSYVQMAQRL